MSNSERGPYKAGKERRNKIIRAARDCLIEEGYAAFSFRKVAKRVGISVGNLQHYYANKQALVDHMITVITEEYMAEIELSSAQISAPEERLFLIIQMITRDLNRFDTTRFFPELWSMANHDSDIQALSDRMYDAYRKVYERPMREINPSLTALQLDKISLFIAAAIEGHTLFIGDGKKYQSRTDDTINMLYQSVLHLVNHSETIFDPK